LDSFTMLAKEPGAIFISDAGHIYVDNLCSAWNDLYVSLS